MTGFDDSSDLNDLVHDSALQAELETVCKAVFKRFPDLPHDTWQELKDDIFIKVCKTIEFKDYNNKTNSKGFLYRIARNYALDIIRSPKHISPRKVVDLEQARHAVSNWTEKMLLDYLEASEILDKLTHEERKTVDAWLQGKASLPAKIIKKIRGLQ